MNYNILFARPAPQPKRAFFRKKTRFTGAAHFFTLEKTSSLQDILRLPHQQFIETTAQLPNTNMLNMAHDAPELFLSLTTASCYQQQIAHDIIIPLAKRLQLTQELCNDIETCLHEAILNSIMHGNLGLESSFNTPENMQAFYAEMDRRIAQDAYKYKRINVCIWEGYKYLKLAISDEGKGFPLPSIDTENTAPHGRGLQLIQTMANKAWIGEDNRTLYMVFARE